MEYDDSDDDSSGGAAVLLGALFIGAAFMALDQYTKRQNEEQRFRAELDIQKTQLVEREQELATLSARLGPANEKVRLLLEHVLQLRAQVRRSA